MGPWIVANPQGAIVRHVSQRLSRSAKVRTDGANMLVEGTGDDYGWMSNYALAGGTLGDYDPGGSRPSWWVGSDDDRMGGGFGAIGPNGPSWSPDGYPWQGNRGWWNRDHAGAGLLPAITRCTEVISQPIIRTPWVMETPRGPQSPPLWVTDPQLAASVPGDITSVIPAGRRLTGHAFWSSILVDALWWGRGVFVFAEGSEGPLPGTFRQLNPYLVGADERGRFVIDPHGDNPVETDFDGRFEMGGETWRLAVIRGLPPHNTTVPEGVLVRHFDTLRLGAAVSKYVASTFASGVPSGYLKVSQPNMTADQASALKSQWMAAHGKGSRSIAVLGATVDFQPISVTPVDADADKMARMSRIDIAHAFGLSAAWLDTGDGSLTYANITDRRRDLVDTTLAGWGRSMMEGLSALLPYGTTLRIAWQMFTAPDIATQVPVLVQAVGAGIMTAEEARALLGMDAEAAATETTLAPDRSQQDG